MPLPDTARIARDRAAPRIVTLWQALTALRSVVSFMNTGAHPDDEISEMLAAMRFRDGIDISYACSTRGEGGQNDIGTETTDALGVLRTAEMEAACDVLDLRMYWLSTSPDDTIFDFGFSKSGDETLEKWGRARTLQRFVHIIRSERPDIICPTFLDVPGQHGHHRAMTEAAHLVCAAAADPEFEGCDLPVWQVAKMYLPAWSGAGQAYDDDLPPPPATMVFKGRGIDPVTGWSYARIGQQSRAKHATQAMGRWVPDGQDRDFPLHLVHSHVGGPDVTLTSGLAMTLRDLAPDAADKTLAAAQDHIDAALAAFPDQAAIARHAAAALDAIRTARSSLDPASLAAFGHKLARKETQLATVIRLATGSVVRGRLGADVLRAGETAELSVDTGHSDADVAWHCVLPDGWQTEAGSVAVGASAQTSDPYPDTYFPDCPSAPCLSVDVTLHGITATSRVPFEVPPVVVPARSASVSPAADVLNAATDGRRLTVTVKDIGPSGAALGLDLPDGWHAKVSGSTIDVTAPEDVAPGLYRLALTLDGQPAQSVQHIQRPHIAPRALTRPAEIAVRVVDAALPDVRVGYIGGGNDRVAHWLDRMGVDVTDLSDGDLSPERLAGFDTIVVGIFAMKFRPGLGAALPDLHGWTAAGGTLVTLYHRPWDNWDPDTTAPHRLEIGQPSLRWRVTNEQSEVRLLAPDHPLLHHPNRIGTADWADWHKERGLYFAKSWDAAYTPLISMNDTGEAPLDGAWLAADVGQGRHVHTSLILHHQMEKLTPGAFRIMANLLARRG